MRLPKREPKWRQWNPDHPLLKDPNAPHETNGVMRIYRAGIPAARISRLLGWAGTRKLEEAMNRALAEEYDAKQRGAVIYDGLIAKGTH